MTVKFAMKGNWIGRLVTRLAGPALLLCVAASFAAAQDFPMLKGDPNRTGKSSAPNTSGPGKGLLTWYRPNFTDSVGKTQTVDNTYMPNPATDPNYVAKIGIWFPPDLAGEASNPFLPTDTFSPQPGVTYAVSTTVTAGVSSATQTLADTTGIVPGDTLHFVTAGVDAVVSSVTDQVTVVLTTSISSTTGEVVNDTSPRPDYLYASAIASDTSGDPRVPLNPGDTLSTFSWIMRNPTAPFYDGQAYAIYAYLPTGPTTVAGVQRFPQRKYVYEIDYAGGAFLDVVDTDMSGFGWIRLGNGGRPTDLIFPADGVNPIKVTLFNTIPRDPETGILSTDPLTGPIVYADAVRAIPAIGRYDATPIVGTFIGPAGSETRTIAALNQQSVKRVTLTTTVVTGATSKIQNLASTDGMHSGDLLSFGSPPTASSPITLVQDLNHVLLASSVYTTDGELVSDNTLGTINKGVVTSYDFNTGARRWTMSPLQESSLTFQEDNDNSNVVVTGSDWVADPPAIPTANNYRGANYLTAPVLSPPATAATASTVEYRSISPSGSNLLNPGPYEIYVWIPGNSNGISFAHNLQYEVHEGTTVSVFTVDQSVASGWTKVGNRSFLHSVAQPLKLVVTNFSADPGDTGLQAFTDEVRFVGPTDLAVKSTPLQITVPIRLTPGGTPVDHPVVIVAAENGVIYCLDAEGRGDGSTDILWTYPSTPDPSTPDPNINAPENIDGTGNVLKAQMPSHFNLSSATVATVTRGGAPEDDLYIGADNGRVYCIELAGRGDFNLNTRKPGTTRRIWTYPDDYPALTKPSLTNIEGSIAIATNTKNTNGPTVFVPTDQGRLYAIDATGNNATHTTTDSTTNPLLWTYPKLTDPPLGPMIMTPAVDFNEVFIGSLSPDFGNTPGTFAALDWNSGVPVWTLSGTAKPLSDFSGGPATVSGATLGSGIDTVFVANGNGGIYGLDAATGTIQWESYEMEAPAQSPLTYSFMSVFDTTGVQTPAPVVIAPQSDGRISIFNALASAVTLTGGHRVGGYTTQSNNLTDSVSTGDGFMYFGDNAGYLYALSDVAGVFPPGTVPPLGTVAGGNTPSAPDYSNAKIKLVTKNAYVQLRQGTMYYADALDPANQVTRNPMAFEWGETIYLLVYNFPYMRAGTTVPPVVNVNFSVGGETIRNVFTEAHIFPGVSDPSDPSYPAFSPTNPFSGYAILSFTIQGVGPNALPPGSGQITIGFNTVDTTGAPINYPSSFTQTVFVANPLSLVIPSTDGPDQTIGYTNVTSFPENLSNGSDTVTNLFGSVGGVANGQSADITIGVVDRSLVELIRGPGRGLQSVRVERSDLAWMNSNTPGYGAPLNPIDPILFPNFEDLPGSFPNYSLDYPDISREQITVTSNPNGITSNPVDYPVELVGPTAADGSPLTETNATSRALISTPFDFVLHAPRFQPANQMLGSDHNSATPNVPAGYLGNYYVFVDSSGNGILDRPNSFNENDSQAPSNTREAFRNFVFGGAVTPDERISVLTPTLDLGSLAEGTGYTPAPPGPANGLFNPWSGTFEPLFKPFDVANEGNVNLLNLRLAKTTTTDDTNLDPWQILSPANEDLAYLSGNLDFWTDMDPGFAPTKDISPDAPVILQKSRVGDRAARKLSPNPVARVNANLGLTADTPRLSSTTYPVGPPRLAATVPFGFPVGTYTGILRVIEDTDTSGQVKFPSGAYTMPGTNAASMSQDLDPSGNLIEANSDPSLKVILKVREPRVTSTSTPMTSPFLDNLVSGSEPFRYSNLQPSGFRSPANGSLVAAMSSNRGTWSPASQPATARTTNEWRIFLSAVAGADPATAPGVSPLRDLYAFSPDTADGRWFQQSTQTANGFPDASIDGNIWGPYYIGGTAQYGSPVFPADGMLDPFRDVAAGMGTPLPNSLMAFVGDAQVNQAGSNRTQSKIFVAPVTVDGTGATGVGNVYAMTNDPDAEKGRPSIVQTQTGFILFYAATVGGRSSIYYVQPSGNPGASQYDGSYFTDSSAIDMGQAFDSVASPYVVGRVYKGASPPDPSQYSNDILEMTFTGKLRNRPVSELFYGRIYLDKTTLAPALLAPLPVRTREPLESSAQAGTYMSNGVRWVTGSTVTVEVLNGGVYTDIEVPNTRLVERDTGIITFDTKLGGKAYLDPNMGSVRLTGAMPPHSANLVLTYQPRFLRISEGTTAGYASSNLAVDERVIPDISYWHRGGDQSPVDASDPVRPGRFLFTYARAAAGAGQAARPTLKSLRFGIDLPFPVFTNPDGSTGSVTVTGVQYYQIDPAKKKIYVTADDEDRPISVTYQAADEGTGASLGMVTYPKAGDPPITAQLITERPEELVPLDQASNETNLFMFLDPFDYMNPRRPGLVWLFWSSTRTGAPDVYMQTIAPRFTPVVTGK